MGRADFQTDDPLQRGQIRSPKPSLWNAVLQRKQARVVGASRGVFAGWGFAEKALIMFCGPCVGLIGPYHTAHA
jgi:hypothetical protein